MPGTVYVRLEDGGSNPGRVFQPGLGGTTEQTLSFINSRRRHQDLFTGRRQSAIEGYSAVLREIGLEEELSIEQAKKKWDNLVRKFRTLKTEKDEVETCIGVQTSTNWPFYEAMKKAITDRENEEEYDDAPSPNCESSLETTPNITLKSEKNLYKPSVSQQNLKSECVSMLRNNKAEKRKYAMQDIDGAHIITLLPNGNHGQINNTPCSSQYSITSTQQQRTMSHDGIQTLPHSHVCNDMNEYDAFGVIVAAKLQKLDSQQRLFAENIINQALFKGALCQLSENTTLLDASLVNITDDAS
uniref:Myb/SANT-like DNA-binding domain-containing protein n=1 Tax=Timema monikensis TaxID=170555 RepID=A0A7R9EEA4_9NEOP|nr:unnamed protein product [Timema monikensis]